MHKDWFAPPERKQSRQGDIFSLGVIAYMLMTNKIPQHSSSGAPYFADIELKARWRSPTSPVADTGTWIPK